MLNDKTVSDHYRHGDLLNAIQASLVELGKTVDSVTIEDLGLVDEFHIGGRRATERFLDQLNFSQQDHILDVGCGIGGASRFAAHRYNSRVTGIDLTEEYIETGKALCSWVNLDKQVTLQQGSALSMPFEDESFDGGYMLHVAMNIEDKSRLFSEVYRVLRPGASFGIYDVMRDKDGELSYPVPWATENKSCRLATLLHYRRALDSAGFKVVAENSRREFALEFFREVRAKTQAKGGPPPLGLHTVMKESTGIKTKNMVANILAGYIVPFELITHKQ